MKNSGLFITFEGIDGTGKTTHLKRLATRLEAIGIPIFLAKEPGDIIDGKHVGSDIGAQIRQMIFFNPTSKNMALGVADALFLADHIQLAEKFIRPALERGEVVLCDRYADSQFAYGPAKHSPEWSYAAYADNFGPSPDMTVLLIGNPEILATRTKRGGTEAGKQDGKSWASVETQRMIQGHYIDQLVGQFRTYLVDMTNFSIDQVEAIIWTELIKRFDLSSYKASKGVPA